MAKRALVIGSELPPLRAVNDDVAAMSTLFGKLGFSVDRRINADATREGIRDGYKRLIADSASTDAAAIYYCGHGGYALNAAPKPGERERLQCIFPTDWTDTGDFRGILDLELSKWQADLTTKTPNVTVILDCCHSAELSRGPAPTDLDDDLVARVYGAVWAENVEKFLANNPVDLSRVHVESNPHAVRIVAAEVERSAYEGYVTLDGDVVRRGFFTYALQQVLAGSSGAALSWRTIVNRVRELVLALTPKQRPTVEGPADRRAFTTTILDRPDAVVYARRDGTSLLRASRILGANVGATYHIMPFGVTKLSTAAAIATAKVVEIVGLDARVDIIPTEPTAPPPEDGSLAFPDEVPYPPVPIVIQGPDHDRIRELIHNIRFAVEVPRDQARFTITADENTIELFELGRRAASPIKNDPDGRRVLSDRLARWAKAESVRTLVTTGLPHDAIELRWGRVENGAEIPHVPGERLHVGESVYVTFTNHTATTLYVAVFDIGLGGNVTLLTSGSADGRPVAPGATSYLPMRNNNAISGLGPMHWPVDVPRDAERRESFVVIAATKLTTFTSLETPPATTRGTANRLETLLDSFRDRTTRDAPSEGAGAAGDGFWVGTIDFDLVPTPRSPFAVDQSIDANGYAEALTVARSAGARTFVAPRRVAVRINDVSIHKNRALWGKARVRLDALVITGAGSKRGFLAETAYFPRIGNGEPLPLKNVRVYEGPVNRFLDFAIWVSRDEKETARLQDLLASNAQNLELQSALTTLAAVAVAAPQAGAIVGVGLAISTVISVASKLLDATIGSSIGVYRRSFLAHESYGLGRHPVTGLSRIQDFSFAFSIEPTHRADDNGA